MTKSFSSCFVALVLLSNASANVAHAQTLQGFATKLTEIFTTTEIGVSGEVAYGGCVKVDPAIGIPPRVVTTSGCLSIVPVFFTASQMVVATTPERS